MVLVCLLPSLFLIEMESSCTHHPASTIKHILLILLTAAAKSLQSCPTLCDPIDGSPLGCPVLGFSRLEHWSGLSFPSPMHESKKSKWSRSVVSDSATPWTAAHQAPPSMGFSRQEYCSGVPLPSPKQESAPAKLQSSVPYSDALQNLEYLKSERQGWFQKRILLTSQMLCWSKAPPLAASSPAQLRASAGLRCPRWAARPSTHPLPNHRPAGRVCHPSQVGSLRRCLDVKCHIYFSQWDIRQFPFFFKIRVADKSCRTHSELFQDLHIMV